MKAFGETMTTTKMFTPSKRRYFWFSVGYVLAITIPLSGLLYCLRNFFRLGDELFIAPLLYIPIHVLLTWIEARWVEQDLSIAISEDQITGPDAKGLRWEGTRWKRQSINLVDIDKTKTMLDARKMSRFFLSKIIYSKSGTRLFIPEVFTKEQSEAIFRQVTE